MLAQLLRTAPVLTAALATATLAAGCGDMPSDNLGSSEAALRRGATVLEVLQNDSDYSTLVAALEFTGLDAAVADPNGDLTLLAPDNDAFEALLADLGLTAGELLSQGNEGLVSDVLLYHVLGGTVPRRAVLGLDGASATTLQGEDVDINILFRTFIQLNGSAFVTDADNFAGNGVVHGINAVLLPPSIFGSSDTLMDKLRSEERFSTLVAAVEFAELEGALSDPSSHLTLLAPDNRAFDRTLASLGLTAADLLTPENKGLLTSILLYHLIDGEVRSDAVRAASGSDVATLQGESVSVRVFGPFIRINSSFVTRADIDTSNGVIHRISGVLLPPSTGL